MSRFTAFSGVAATVGAKAAVEVDGVARGRFRAVAVAATAGAETAVEVEAAPLLVAGIDGAARDRFRAVADVPVGVARDRFSTGADAPSAPPTASLSATLALPSLVRQ